MAKYYFEKEDFDMELDRVMVHHNMIVKFLDWCVTYIKGFKFVEFYDDFNKANKGGYDRERFIDMLKEWHVFRSKIGKYKQRQMYYFLKYNMELYWHVQRNMTFDLNEISMYGMVNLYDLTDVLLLRFDDHDHYAPYVLHGLCVGVMWYGLKQLEFSYEKVKDGKILDGV